MGGKDATARSTVLVLPLLPALTDLMRNSLFDPLGPGGTAQGLFDELPEVLFELSHHLGV